MDETTPDLKTKRGRTAFLHHTFDVETYAEACRRAVEDASDDLHARIQFADAQGLLGQTDLRIALLREIIAAHPGDTLAHVTLGIALLTEGRYKEGWGHFRYRFAMDKVAIPDPGLPADRQWTGQPLARSTLCLMREQGLGDTLQFARYALKLRDEGARVYLNVQPALRGLLKGCPAIGRVLMPSQPVELTHWIHLLELVPVFSETAADVTWPGSYIAAPARPGPFALPARRGGRIRAGLAWRGNPKFASERLRAIPLASLTRLGDLENMEFFSLMPPTASAEIDRCGAGAWLSDLAAVTSPFENLAQAVSSMDLVVTTCTSIAHLAGAMGKPVMILLSATPDWRWGRTGTKTPWYPNARLFRQSRLGDWEAPVGRLVDHLSKL